MYEPWNNSFIFTCTNKTRVGKLPLFSRKRGVYELIWCTNYIRNSTILYDTINKVNGGAQNDLHECTSCDAPSTNQQCSFVAKFLTFSEYHTNKQLTYSDHKRQATIYSYRPDSPEQGSVMLIWTPLKFVPPGTNFSEIFGPTLKKVSHTKENQWLLRTLVEFTVAYPEKWMTAFHKYASAAPRSIRNVCSLQTLHKVCGKWLLRGPDGISSTIPRNTATSISSKLTTLFNLSLRLGKVPSQWKVSNVIQILKSGDPSNASNYRPISLLSLVSKVLECIIFKQISHHLSINRLLSKNQFDFRSGFSTHEALFSVTIDWHQLLSKIHPITAFFYVKKAFDSVPHTLVIQSLSSVGISGPLLSWFEDYLTGRQQRVVVDGVSSPLSPVTSGVPQGLILSPLLFIIFMNSIINYLPLSSGSKLVLYADDIVLYRPINSPEDITIIQEDINQILNWTKAHGLTLNPAKQTSYQSFALPGKLQFTLILDQILYPNCQFCQVPVCYHNTWLVMEKRLHSM